MSYKRKAAVIVALVLVVLIAASITAYFGIQKSVAFKVAQTYVVSLPEVQKLGPPVRANLKFFGYSIHVTDSSGTAQFSFTAKGTTGRAVAYVELKKNLGKWEVIDSRITQ